jgi:hypothetical protein
MNCSLQQAGPEVLAIDLKVYENSLQSSKLLKVNGLLIEPVEGVKE